MVSLSRISPSMTMPAAPRAIISASMISPMMALGPAPPASTTITSPEPQMSMAWCTMRLSPGRVRTVSARPTSGPWRRWKGRSAEVPVVRLMASLTLATGKPR